MAERHPQARTGDLVLPGTRINLDSALRQEPSPWANGMDGWRVEVLYNRGGASQFGEVTGYENGIFWLVMDDETEPIEVPWDHVRPR